MSTCHVGISKDIPSDSTLDGIGAALCELLRSTGATAQQRDLPEATRTTRDTDKIRLPT